MEHLPHWWLLLFARAVAENKQLLGYEFTLETCENATHVKNDLSNKQKVHRQEKNFNKIRHISTLKNRITKPFPRFNFQNVTSLTSLLGLKIQFIKYKSSRATDTNSIINNHQN